MRWRRTTACERAVQSISLALDDEIDALDLAALERHLQRCDQCRRESVEIGGFTRLLRDSSVLGLESPLTVQTPRRRRVRVTRAGAIALAAAAVLVGGVTTFPPRPARPSAAVLGFVNSQEQRRFAREHVSMEPVVFLVASPSPVSFAERALR